MMEKENEFRESKWSLPWDVLETSSVHIYREEKG